MTDGFVEHWSNVIKNPEDEGYELGKKMIDTPKVVFTRTMTESAWVNTTLAHDLVADVNKLKESDGRDIIVYGGAGFVTSLINENLIDDYYLFVNPAAIGDGLTIFGSAGGTKRLKLIESTPHECGVVVNHYQPA